MSTLPPGGMEDGLCHCSFQNEKKIQSDESGKEKMSDERLCRKKKGRGELNGSK